MEKGTHQIRSQVFEVEFAQEAKAVELKQRLVDHIKLRLLSMIEEVFDEVCPPGVIIKIPNITIDLGEIDLLRIESELEYRLKIDLKKYLTEVLEEAGRLTHSDVEIITEAKSKTDVILSFLKTGNLPWWGKTVLSFDETFDLIEILRAIFEEDEKQLVLLFSQVIKTDVLIKRLRKELGTKGLVEVIALISNDYNELLRFDDLKKEIADVEISHEANKLSDQQIEEIVWESALITLVRVLERKITYASVNTLIEETIERLSKVLNKTRKEVLLEIHRYVLKSASNKSVTKTLLQSFISRPEIQEKIKSGLGKFGSSKTSKGEEAAYSEKYSEKEAQTIEENRKSETKTGTIEILGEYLTTEEIKSRWQQRATRVHWIEKLEKPQFFEIIKAIAPGEKKRTEVLFTDIQSFVESFYWKTISPTQSRGLIFEIFLDQYLTTTRLELVLEEAVKRIFQIIADRRSIPQFFVYAEVIRATDDFQELRKWVEKLAQKSQLESYQVLENLLQKVKDQKKGLEKREQEGREETKSDVKEGAIDEQAHQKDSAKGDILKRRASIEILLADPQSV
ncbi:hypothetical protein E1176_03310, partial [Fulvivirga sp. RKSG066]|uniref:contractile injection system tape measure protein n=1 Tax=Fulvivirga aurantia TaxID=2529383 RepID=UPI0012BC5C52